MKSEGSCNLVLILVSWLSWQSDMLRLYPRDSLILPFASLAYSLLYVPSITVLFNLSIFLHYTSLHSAFSFLADPQTKSKVFCRHCYVADSESREAWVTGVDYAIKNPFFGKPTLDLHSQVACLCYQLAQIISIVTKMFSS